MLMMASEETKRTPTNADDDARPLSSRSRRGRVVSRR
jgi:hypothetical protein